MNSAQRIINITELDEEAPLTTSQDSKISLNFPQNGDILFKNIHMQYRPNTPKVLNGLTFSIRNK